MNLLRPDCPESAKLNAIRQEHSALGKEIKKTERAANSLEEIGATLRTTLRRQIEHDDPIYQLRKFRTHRAGEDDWHPTLPELSWGMVAVLFGEEEVVQRLLAPLAKLDAAAPGLSNADREKSLTALRAKRRDLERREEQEILRLKAARWDVLRRPDADPRLLFEIWATQ